MSLDRLRLLESGDLDEMLRACAAPTHLFCGHLHRNVSGTWSGHPVAALKSTHVQFELDMTGDSLSRSAEPPAYAAIGVRNDNVVINFRDLVSGVTPAKDLHKTELRKGGTMLCRD